jgi:hypothetical protein
MSELDQTEKNSARAHVFRLAPESGHCATESACPFRDQKQTLPHLYLARAYGSDTSTRGSSALTEVLNCAGSTFLRCAHSTRFAGRYVGSARHRLKTLASIVSLILMWLPSFAAAVQDLLDHLPEGDCELAKDHDISRMAADGSVA